jgi:hypothetical protein
VFLELQKSMYRMRWVYCMDSGGKDEFGKSPGDIVIRVLAHSACTALEGREMGMESVAVEVEEPAARDAGVQCSRVEVVGDGAEEEDPVACGGDDATSSPP